MSSEPVSALVKDFLTNSWSCVQTIAEYIPRFQPDYESKVRLFCFKNDRMNETVLDHGHIFLRASVEYSNPQLTVEEVQGIVAARLLAVCGNYFRSCGLHQPDSKDIEQICELLTKPPQGIVIPFLLNTDETEPDRYSMNPLKQSIVDSGQSAFPSAMVRTEQLKIDEKFVQKYDGALISGGEVELISRHLKTCNNSYMDMADAVKYEQLESLSQTFGIDLNLYALRMPLTILANETTEGLVHYLIRQVHVDYGAVEQAYNYMSRSMKNRTTLLTVPHSKKGYASKRVASGKLHFEGTRLKSISVKYHTKPLYPNAIDPEDVSVAMADDSFTVDGDRLVNYDFRETPSSPQFFLYSLASPEDAVIWHGIGAFGAAHLLGSYSNVRRACSDGSFIKDLKAKYGICAKVPLQFNLVPKYMWFHPVHRNIDASIGCVENLRDLANIGMRLEYLAAYEQTAHPKPDADQQHTPVTTEP